MTYLPYPPNLPFRGRVGALLCCAALGLALPACRKTEPKQPIVAPVRVSPAIKGSIRLIVNTDAVLYPRDQANIVPKISAPVRRFLVNRGDRPTRLWSQASSGTSPASSFLSSAAQSQRGPHGPDFMRRGQLTKRMIPPSVSRWMLKGTDSGTRPSWSCLMRASLPRSRASASDDTLPRPANHALRRAGSRTTARSEYSG